MFGFDACAAKCNSKARTERQWTDGQRDKHTDSRRTDRLDIRHRVRTSRDTGNQNLSKAEAVQK